MARRQGRANILTLLLVAVLAVLGVGAYTFVPYYIDYLNMKEIASSSGLAWYASTLEKSGPERLAQGLKMKEIDYIDPSACEFKKEQDDIVVYCYWEAYAYYPMTDYYKILTFEVTTYVDSRGTVEQY
jgi:hypothetical protein